jgi:hypothetical protein
MAHENAKNDKDAQLAELSALVELGLGGRLDPKTFDELASIQFALRAEQEKLAGLLESGKLDPKQYLSSLNAVLRRAMEQSHKVLGGERFLAIFGEAGLQPENLVDPETFFGEAPHAPARSR